MKYSLKKGGCGCSTSSQPVSLPNPSFFFSGGKKSNKKSNKKRNKKGNNKSNKKRNNKSNKKKGGSNDDVIYNNSNVLSNFATDLGSGSMRGANIVLGQPMPSSEFPVIGQFL